MLAAFGSRKLKERIRASFIQPFLAHAGAFALAQLSASLRWQYEGVDNLQAALASGRPIILCIWHRNLLMLPPIWFRADLGEARTRPLAFLISRSRDGGLASALARRYRVLVIRGSAAKNGRDKGGFDSLGVIFDHLQGDGILGITPDGPRGPIYSVPESLLLIAQKSGALLVPLAWASRRAYAFRSWDRITLPLPFSRAIAIWGRPFAAERRMDAPARQAWLASFKAEMDRAQQACERAVVDHPIGSKAHS